MPFIAPGLSVDGPGRDTRAADVRAAVNDGPDKARSPVNQALLWMVVHGLTVCFTGEKSMRLTCLLALAVMVLLGFVGESRAQPVASASRQDLKKICAKLAQEPQYNLENVQKTIGSLFQTEAARHMYFASGVPMGPNDSYPRMLDLGYVAEALADHGAAAVSRGELERGKRAFSLAIEISLLPMRLTPPQAVTYMGQRIRVGASGYGNMITTASYGVDCIRIALERIAALSPAYAESMKEPLRFQKHVCDTMRQYARRQLAMGPKGLGHSAESARHMKQDAATIEKEMRELGKSISKALTTLERGK